MAFDKISIVRYYLYSFDNEQAYAVSRISTQICTSNTVIHHSLDLFGYETTTFSQIKQFYSERLLFKKFIARVPRVAIKHVTFCLINGHYFLPDNNRDRVGGELEQFDVICKQL